MQTPWKEAPTFCGLVDTLFLGLDFLAEGNGIFDEGCWEASPVGNKKESNMRQLATLEQFS